MGSGSKANKNVLGDEKNISQNLNNKGLEHTEPTCDDNEDCPDRYFCNEDKEMCQRENIFPLKTWDYIGIVCLSFFATLTTSAGIGGGEIIVPTIKILFQYVQSEASTLSQCCIMMAGIASKKHPYRNAVAIEYKVAMLLMPSIFFGLSLGVMLHKIVPNFVQEISLLLVLILCLYESLKKGIIVWKEESSYMKINSPKYKSLASCDSPIKRSIIEDYDSDDDISSKSSFLFITAPVRALSLPMIRGEDRLLRYSSKVVPSIKEENEITHSSNVTVPEEVEKLERMDDSHWQLDKLAPIWGIFILLVVQTVLKDGDFAGIKNCSTGFWAIYITYAFLCFVAVIYSAFAVQKDYEYRQAIGFPDFKGNVVLNTQKILCVTLITISCGIFASIVGVGGSIFYIQMMMGLGYPPFVASSTSMFLVMYSAAANTISYSVSGKLSISNGLWLGIWTMVGVVLGVFGANKIIQKTGRQSIFIFVLALLLILSIISLIVFDLAELIDDIADGNFELVIGDFCK